MNLFSFALMADENIAPDVIAGLRTRGSRIASLHESGLSGSSDEAILRRSTEEGRVVITHDPDFARLAVTTASPFVGIVYLRPGHIRAAVVLAALDALNAGVDLEPPFVATVSQKPAGFRVRLRHVRRS
jgi:predicted nuclease of predicted toxin-antitoxin system